VDPDLEIMTMSCGRRLAEWRRLVARRAMRNYG